MTGGSLTTTTGDLFYVTNTSCTIDLSGVSLKTANGTLLRVEGNSSSRGWGTAGANGGDVVMTADGQTMAGEIDVDAISTLDLTMKNKSSFTGSINSAGAAGTVAVTLSSDSTWTLTADSYVTSFTGSASNVVAGSYHLYVNGTLLV